MTATGNPPVAACVALRADNSLRVGSDYRLVRKRRQRAYRGAYGGVCL